MLVAVDRQTLAHHPCPSQHLSSYNITCMYVCMNDIVKLTCVCIAAVQRYV